MADAISFMRIRALSVPAMLLCIVAEGAYRAFLDLKTPFIIIVASALMNIALNAAFLFGVFVAAAAAAPKAASSVFLPYPPATAAIWSSSPVSAAP